jgi:hypothetical protein
MVEEFLEKGRQQSQILTATATHASHDRIILWPHLVRARHQF